MKKNCFLQVYNLEVKYQSLYEPLNNKRKAIVNGEYEPTAEEQEWKLQESEEDEITDKLEGISIAKPNYPEDVKGIPDFWLTIFRVTELISGMIQKPDEDVLKKLTDITISYSNDPMSYTLEFHFAPNEFFTDLVLTKQYFLKVKVEAEHPFAFEGPEIYKCLVSRSDNFLLLQWSKLIFFPRSRFVRVVLSIGTKERISQSKPSRRSRNIRLEELSVQ